MPRRSTAMNLAASWRLENRNEIESPTVFQKEPPLPHRAFRIQEFKTKKEYIDFFFFSISQVCEILSGCSLGFKYHLIGIGTAVNLALCIPK